MPTKKSNKKPEELKIFFDDVAAEMAAKLAKNAKGAFQLPAGHQPGMTVPKGGSCCANCKYSEVRADGPYCTNTYFVEWHGEAKLPAPADEYCSDWWEPK